MREADKLARLSVLILVLGVLNISSERAFAAHFLRFNVWIDGKAVLEGGVGDDGQDADTVWRYLKTSSLRPIRGYRVEPDPEDPLRATLRGKVIIRAESGGQTE